MKYMEKIKTTAVDISDILKKQKKELIRIINESKSFCAGEEGYDLQNKGRKYVYIRQATPFSINGGTFLFHRVEICQYKNIEKSSKELIKQLIEEIGINRLHDEDGQNGIFSRTKNTGDGIDDIEDSAYCYMNPFIPEGYWENHILETRYISII